MPDWYGQTMSYTDKTWLYWTATTSGTNVTDTTLLNAAYATSTATTWTWNASQLTVEAWESWMDSLPADEQRKKRHKIAHDRLIRANRNRTAELRRKIASRLAEELLLDNLSDEQADQWRDEKAFTLETADGLRRYKIRRGVAGNIMLVKDGDREAEPGHWLRRYCFHGYHPDGEQCPPEDHCLAQKLFIETAEDEFLRMANPA